MAEKSLAQWLHWLEHDINFKKIDLTLERILPVAQQLQVTDFAIPVIMVAGTNGKGTSVALLESIYQAAGYHTAAYTSPHLIEFKERLRIDGKTLSEAQWCQAMKKVDQARGDVVLSYFEFTVLAGLAILQQQQAQLDVLLLEVGLGGRLDAVNVVNADVAVITTIDFDHMEYLGDTREKIGKEKAGIMRANKLAVCGDVDVPATVIEHARELQTPLYCQTKDFSYQAQQQTWRWQNATMELVDLPVPKIPLQNAATVLEVIHLLQDKLAVSTAAIAQGLRDVTVAGRLQQLRVEPEVILDVAHNPHAASYLAQQLPKVRHGTGRVLAVVAMKQDKDIEKTLAMMKPIVDCWYVADLQGHNPATAKQLSIHLQGEKHQTFAMVTDAYDQALTDAADNDTIIVFGSFFTVGPILEKNSEPAEIA